MKKYPNIRIHLSRFLFVLGFIASLLFSITPPKAFSKELFDVGFVIILFCVFVFFRFSQRSSLNGYWLKPSNLFLLAFLAVNFQYLLDFRLGLKTSSSSNILHTSVLNHCFLLGLVGLLAFVAGYLRSFSEEKKRRKNREGTGLDLRMPDSVRFPITVLHAMVFGVFLYSIDMSSFLSGESYGESMTTYAHVEKLLGAMNAAVVLCAAIKTKEGGSVKSYLASFPIVSLIVLGAYMLLRLISGDRGPFVYTALLIFYGFAFVNRKRYKLITTILILLIGASSMAVIGIARSLDLSQGFLSRVSDASDAFASRGRFGDKSISPLTDELGFSFVVNQTDVYAIEVEEESLHPGTYLIISILNGIPFVPGLITRAFHISYEDFSSTGFANVHFFHSLDRTWSIGTTIVGDFYLQFSVWGVLLGLFLAGLIMKEIDLALYVRDKKKISMALLLFALVYSSKCLYIPRSLLFGELATFIMAFLIVFVLNFLFAKKR